MDGIFEESNFETFATSRPFGQDSLDQSWVSGGGGIQGSLESNPHNRIHCTVGGTMCSAISPQDPIFLTHHGNIDRIWAAWNSLGHLNSSDPLWLDMEFTDHFVAPDGSSYSKTVNDLQDTESLGYTYTPTETPTPVPDPLPVDPEREKLITTLFETTNSEESAIPRAIDGLPRVRVKNEAVAEALNPAAIQVGVGQQSLASVGTVSGARSGFEPVSARSPEVIAFIKNIEATDQHVTAYRVFVNCDYLSQETPTTDPHYVTTFGFFGEHKMSHDGNHKKPPSIGINLTATLQSLNRQKLLTGDDITVQILPVPTEGTPLEKTGTALPAEVEISIV